MVCSDYPTQEPPFVRDAWIFGQGMRTEMQALRLKYLRHLSQRHCEARMTNFVPKGMVGSKKDMPQAELGTANRTQQKESASPTVRSAPARAIRASPRAQYIHVPDKGRFALPQWFWQSQNFE